MVEAVVSLLVVGAGLAGWRRGGSVHFQVRFGSRVEGRCEGGKSMVAKGGGL